MNMNRQVVNFKEMQTTVNLASILKIRLTLSLLIWFRLIITAVCTSPNNPDVSLSSGIVKDNDINFCSLYSYIDSVNLTTNEERPFEEVNKNLEKRHDNEVSKETDRFSNLQNQTKVQNSLTRCDLGNNLDDKQGNNTNKFTGTKDVGIVYYIAKKLSQEVRSKKFISLCNCQLDKYNGCQSAILELYVKLAQHIKRCENSERIDLAPYDKLLYQLHSLHEFKVGLKRIKNLKTRALVEASFINEYEHSFVLDGTLCRFLPEDTILKQEIETIFANRKKQ